MLHSGSLRCSLVSPANRNPAGHAPKCVHRPATEPLWKGERVRISGAHQAHLIAGETEERPPEIKRITMTSTEHLSTKAALTESPLTKQIRTRRDLLSKISAYSLIVRSPQGHVSRRSRFSWPKRSSSSVDGGVREASPSRSRCSVKGPPAGHSSRGAIARCSVASSSMIASACGSMKTR